MRRPYQIAGAILLCLAAFVAVEAMALKYYTSLGPGPGFFSFWLALLLGALALTMILQASLGTPEPRPADFFADRIGYLRMGAVVLASVGATALLDVLGFRLTMFAVYVFLLCALGRQGFLLTLGIALAGSVGVFHVFDRWLRVPLPTGPFGF
jgi:putative tricarboxylic transport membrane protein